MQNLITILIITICINPIYSQQASFYQSCEIAANFPILTKEELESKTFRTSPVATSDPPNPLCVSNGGGIAHNVSYLSFYASENAVNFDLDIMISNCTPQQGIQWGIVENCNYDEVICDGACTDATVYNIITNELIPCEQYWLWIDGCNNSVCDINFIINDGFTNSDSSLTNYYYDFDMDGYGDSNFTVLSFCELPGFVSDSTDCNDNDPTINPMSSEICDNIDNNCNGEIDENLIFLDYFSDSDMDGFGDPNNSISACSQPNGFVLNNTDCDDNDTMINPDAVEK